MVRVLVTGAAGMLGSQLVLDRPDGVEVIGTDLVKGPGVSAAGVDLAEEDEVAALWSRHGPFDGVIHSAAWTAVDAAEEHEREAHRANALAPGILAGACGQAAARLVVVGTDAVFDGRSDRPYREDDEPNPINAYGRTKLAGERAAVEAHPSGTLIVRTQWLYGPRGKHFPRTIVRVARERGALKVVDDQFGAPTSTLELSPALWEALATRATGILHAACEGSCSWHEYAAAILAACDLGHVALEPCDTAGFPRPAARQRYSVLDSSRLAALRGHRLAGWGDALAAYLAVEPL
jgi:dTDP-4-dehydrorhamnose reductase